MNTSFEPISYRSLFNLGNALICFLIVASVALLLNLYILKSFWIGTVALITFFSAGSYILGESVCRIIDVKVFKPLVGLSFFVILFGFPGAALIDFYRFSSDFIAIILLGVTAFLVILFWKVRNGIPKSLKREFIARLKVSIAHPFGESKLFGAFLLIFAIFSLLSLLILVSVRTSLSIFVLWNRIPLVYSLTFFVLTFMTALLIFSSSSKRVRVVLLLVIIHSFVLHCYMPVVYGTIYGSDQWWHMANEESIIRTGVYGPVLFGEGPWKLLNRSETFQGLEVGKLYIKILGFNVPYALVSTKTSYSFLYSFSISISQLLNIDVFFNYWLLVFVIWSLVVPVALFNVGSLVFRNERASLLLAFLPSFFYFFNVYGSVTVPISLGVLCFFPSLLAWINYVRKENSSSLLLAVIFTFVLYFNYSLVWVLSILMGVMAITVMVLANQNNKRSLLFTLLVFVVSAMAVPFLDTLEGRNIFVPQLMDHPLQTLILKSGEFLANRLSVFTFSSPADFFYNTVLYKLSYRSDVFPSLAMLAVMTTFVWFFIVVGSRRALKKTNQEKLPLLFCLLFFLVIEVSTFIVWYLMEGLHGMGYRLDSFRQIFMLFFMVFGFMHVYENFNTKTKRVKTIAVIFSLFLAFGVTAYYRLDSISSNIADYEMEAIRYIYENNPKDNYVVICSEVGDYYLQKLATLQIIGGNLLLYSGNGTFTSLKQFLEASVREQIYQSMKKNPSIELMKLALSKSVIDNPKMVYLLLDKRFDAEAVDKAEKIFPTYKVFDSLCIFVYTD